MVYIIVIYIFKYLFDSNFRYVLNVELDVVFFVFLSL